MAPGCQQIQEAARVALHGCPMKRRPAFTGWRKPSLCSHGCQKPSSQAPCWHEDRRGEDDSKSISWAMRCIQRVRRPIYLEFQGCGQGCLARPGSATRELALQAGMSQGPVRAGPSHPGVRDCEAFGWVTAQTAEHSMTCKGLHRLQRPHASPDPKTPPDSINPKT